MAIRSEESQQIPPTETAQPEQPKEEAAPKQPESAPEALKEVLPEPRHVKLIPLFYYIPCNLKHPERLKTMHKTRWLLHVTHSN